MSKMLVALVLTLFIGIISCAPQDEGISSAEIELLTPIADWHERWGDPSNNPSDREDLISEFDELLTPIVDRLGEPLRSNVLAYEMSHVLVNAIKLDHAYRTAVFVAGADVDIIGMVSPCDLPDAGGVPDDFQQELNLLRLECTSIAIADEFLSESRSLAEKTWLNPNEPSVFIEPSSAEAGLVSLISDWHQLWDASLSLSDEEDLIKDLDTLNSSISGKLNEPLASAVKVYSLNHFVAFMMSNNRVTRAVTLASAADLEGSSLDTFCGSLDEAVVPEKFQIDVDLLELECGTREMAYLSLTFGRDLAEETWLRPFLGSQ